MRSRFRSAIAIALTATLVSAVSGCSSSENSQADSQAIESPVVDDLVQKLVSQASEMSPPQELDEGCTTRVFQSLTSEQLLTIRSSIESDEDLTSDYSWFTDQLANCLSGSATTTTGPSIPPELMTSNTRFYVPAPIQMSLCYDQKDGICDQDWFLRGQIQIGYRLPPREGILAPENRNESDWLSLTPSQRNTYLSVALWNFVARMRLTTDGKTSKLPSPEIIQGDYDNVIEVTKWMVQWLDRGISPVALLEKIQSNYVDQGFPKMAADWLTNAVSLVALPAIAPSYISEVDAVITYT
jgi:hypothetical protein